MALLDDILTPYVPDGKNLFHYTTQDGLLGIIRDKELWVSSILHMNDAAEFNYTVELVRETIKNKRKNEKPPRTDLYDEILKQLRRFEDMTIFVGSFSERRDSLSQWRAYTHNGIGFSVGFEYEYLNRCAQRQGYIIRRCNYDKDKHRR